MAHARRHRDADEEALQAALQDSMAPDFMAQILQAESHQPARATASVSSPASAARPRTESGSRAVGIVPQSTFVDDDDDDSDGSVLGKLRANDSEGVTDDEEEEDVNADHKLLNFAEFLLLDILFFLDEDAVGQCLCSCKRLRAVAKSEVVFEALCRRIFPSQSPRVAHAQRMNKFMLRKFPTWFDMLVERPRVRHNGFYVLKTFYYKKPELNMWTTDILPGTILQVVYYRYFSFQRDGTVLYAMLFKAPHEAGNMLAKAETNKEVFRGTYQVDRDEVFVSVPTNHCVVEFKFRIQKMEQTSAKARGKNAVLVLQEHIMFSEPNRTGWVEAFDTHEEEFRFYRRWGL